MKSIHLFAGIGGGIIADIAAGNTVCGAVEIDNYCRAVIRARQLDGWLPPFPILNDVRDVEGDEFGENIELVCGGFPCQDVSLLNQTGQRGLKGEKTGLFSELVRITDRIRPKFIFLENVSNIVNVCLKEVLATFAQRGYDAEWTCLSAGEVGAWHKRDRWWGLFYVPDAARERWERLSAQRGRMESKGGTTALNDGASAAGEGDVLQQSEFDYQAERPSYWVSEPEIDRVVNGFPTKLDRCRVRALGNAQVPYCAYCAYEQLLYRAMRNASRVV